MARRLPQPLLQARLYPVIDTWVAPPAMPLSVLRFAVMAAWSVPDQEAAEGDRLPLLRPGVLHPDLPYSVLPLSVRDALGLVAPGQPPTGWGARPVPPWRGIPCQLATVRMQVVNDVAPDKPFYFRVLVLLPQRDPAGPRLDHVLLETKFLAHYALRVVVDYDLIRYRAESESGQGRIDPSVPCGAIEKG